MYSESEELMFPCSQNFSHEIQQLEEFFYASQKPFSSMNTLVQSSTISDYDLGGEGDLFKAPEPILGEPVGGLVPMTSAISMISFSEDVITSQGLKVADIESIQTEQLLSEVFYECKKDLLEKTAIESSISEIIDIKIADIGSDEYQLQENNSLGDVPFHKSGSSDSLSSMEWMHGSSSKPTFVNFSGVDLGSLYGMRRAFSEGDIKTLGNGETGILNSAFDSYLAVSTSNTERRKEKLSRYWTKKSKRNFDRKIKYACRKALADNQPRIRGRFAKSEDSEASKK